jgi:hypothetical protein
VRRPNATSGTAGDPVAVIAVVAALSARVGVSLWQA